MQLSVDLGTNFRKKEIVQSRVQRDVEKNISIQKMQKILVPDIVMEAAQKDKKIDKDADKNIWKLMKIWDTSTENMTSDDLRTLRTIVETLPVRSKKTYINVEPKRTKMFKEITAERKASGYSDDRGTAILKFFKSFSKKNKINVDDLSLFVNETLAEDKPVHDNMSANATKATFSNNFIEQQDHEDADELLDGIA
jgi:hypothetical protein